VPQLQSKRILKTALKAIADVFDKPYEYHEERVSAIGLR